MNVSQAGRSVQKALKEHMALHTTVASTTSSSSILSIKLDLPTKESKMNIEVYNSPISTHIHKKPTTVLAEYKSSIIIPTSLFWSVL